MATTTNPAAATAGPWEAPSRRSRARSSRLQRRGTGRWIVLAILTIAVLVTLFPFLLAALNAVKSPADYAEHGPLALPSSIDLTGLRTFYQEVNFTQKLLNSIEISAAVAVIGVALSLLNAYALGIGRVRGRSVILVLFLMAMTVPQESLVYPLYYLSKSVGLFDTKMSVVVIFAILQCAFGTYLLSATLTAFPGEILEAARIDGAGRWKILWTIVLPVVRPTLTVLATFFFIWTWNEFLIPLVMLVSNDNQTVSVAMGTLNGQYTSDPTTTAAAALLGIAPAVIFFLIFQRTLMRGTTAGAVK